jgi:phage terminase large subunit-like protein
LVPAPRCAERARRHGRPALAQRRERPDRHAAWERDGLSTLTFKSYDQGRTKWQGETLHFVWFDEEPPPDLYTEGLTRTNATDGIVWLTFTPLKGMSEVVMQFKDCEGF